MRIDFFADREQDGVRFTKGSPLPFGANYFGDGIVNFSINSVHATSCTLVLFHKGAAKPYVEIKIPEEYCIGNNYSIMLFDINIDDTEYGYKFDGEYDPARNLYFDKDKILLDPFAMKVTGHEIWNEPDYDNTVFPFRGMVMQSDYDWEGDRPINRPLEQSVIYEMHVRGYTMGKDSNVRYPGTFAGLVSKIPYIKSLGVNCIELQPIFEFNERAYDIMDSIDGLDYWGYNTIAFFAPKAGYAHLGPYGMAADELKTMVKTMHKNGIEVILDVVFNHTGEMNISPDKRTTYSFRGIDNPTYYIMNKDGSYADYTGCGNTVNCNHPIVRNMILDCLRYWVASYHIDGFRFDLAPVLGRDSKGRPMLNPPLLETLAMDPILSKTKLIAEAWDAGGLYQVGSFPAPTRWAEWNGTFRDCLRRFMRGEAIVGPELIKRIQGSVDIFSHKTAGSVINFVTCHDGFTLWDLVTYNNKHNSANGSQPNGTDDNLSWNCGCEGDTDNIEINALRRRSIKNAQVITLLSRGTPMLLAGDEFGNTQHGNNNVFCQDNELSWLDWSLAEKNKDMIAFVRKVITLRKAHPVFSRSDFYMGYNSTGYPELSFHGAIAWDLNPNAPLLTFAFMYAESSKDYPVDHDTFIYVGVNGYSTMKTMTLPILPKGFTWKKYLDTSDLNHDDNHIVDEDKYAVGPQTVFVLLGTLEEALEPENVDLTDTKFPAKVNSIADAKSALNAAGAGNNASANVKAGTDTDKAMLSYTKTAAETAAISKKEHLQKELPVIFKTIDRIRQRCSGRKSFTKNKKGKE